VSAELTAWLVVLGYLAMILLTARGTYRKIRPWTEPLSCKEVEYHRVNGTHMPRCYRRVEDVDTETEAIALSSLSGLMWPFIVPAVLAARFIKGGARPLPEELRAQLERLEAENDKLKSQQEAHRFDVLRKPRELS